MNNLANILTLTRLALLPPMIVLFFIPFSWAAWVCLILYIIGAATDWLDGWVARKFNQVTEFGTLMDPITDKIFVVTILLMLVAVGRIENLWVLSVVIIIVREFMVSGLREYLGNKDIKLPVTNLAKWKTTLQMIATGILIVGPYFWGGQMLGQLVLTGASILTLITGWNYLKTALDHMRKMP
ncbi:MAG: CDP-diacylglycerol--glycerol-3-phosphate 3-phosphatidyltransferase [Micavibrio sp.]|nr:MAG: CDP-diacylglycerol--glycerol-3-phosphate 3-phosphatidyltransferase [Micavibrio sp.]